MHYLLRYKSVSLLCLLFCGIAHMANAQREIFRADHDDKPYYFGATLGYANSFLAVTRSKKFITDDSVLVAEPGKSGGIFWV